MIPRGYFITLTGLLLIGGASAAIAQPEPTSAPTPVRVAQPAPTAQAAEPQRAPRRVVVVPPRDGESAVPVEPFVMPPIVLPDLADLEFAFDALARIEGPPMQEFEMPHFDHAFEMPHVEMPHIEMPHFDHAFDGPQKIDVDSAEMVKAIKEATKAGDKARKDLEYAWKDIERAKWDTEHVKELVAGAKEFKLAGLSELHLPRFGQGPAQVRIFERCDSWRGSKSEDIEDRYYDCGRNAVDQSQWERAVDYFGRAAAAKGTRADGALYWKAWAQNRLGQRAEALTTLSLLKSAHAKSRWVNDASALEVEIRQRTGQSIDPAVTQDDELQLIALNGLRDKPSAVPILENFLQGPRSPKLKERALFVLAQNDSPAARVVLAKVAKGEANPELQLKAVQYLGNFKSPETRDILSQAYKTSADAQVKRAILRAYMNAQDRERLLDAARSETDASLRLEAVRQLGNMQAVPELVDLYGRESSADVKKQIQRALVNSGQIERLAAIAQSEQDPELKRAAIRAMGTDRKPTTGPTLIDIYSKDQNRVVREAVIDALFVQGNAAALIGLARREKDPELKRKLVEKLSVMRDNPEAEAYMLELLK